MTTHPGYTEAGVPAESEFFLWMLFTQLQRRRFPLGTEDYAALRLAMEGGFGWLSNEELCDLCCALWAKSPREQEVVAALFEELLPGRWNMDPAAPAEQPGANTGAPSSEQPPPISLPVEMPEQSLAVSGRYGKLPPISMAGVKVPERHFVFVPQFPLTYREVAQAWRRLRRPVREGPSTELDVEATIAQRSRLGVATPVVLVPPRRNTARVVVLVDRQGSMAPFHLFVDEVVAAIRQSARLETVDLFYFHDVPAEGADQRVLAPLAGQLFPTLDTILPQIVAHADAFVYEDPDLLRARHLHPIMRERIAGADTIIIGDAGAARGRYDALRLLDTVAFARALRQHGARYVWLNPLPASYWHKSTAAQVARHLPMLPLDHPGIQQAVNILRGHPYFPERPI